MPPKRKKSIRKKKSTTQQQSQRQSVVVNIGTKKSSGRKKASGRGGLPPPSYQHNLAPTFVTGPPQIDYSPLIMSLLNKVQEPIRNPVTPLSLSTPSVQQMAGIRAEERRNNLQPMSAPVSEPIVQPMSAPVSQPISMPFTSPIKRSGSTQDINLRFQEQMMMMLEDTDAPQRRAGPTASNLQPMSSQTQERATEGEELLVAPNPPQLPLNEVEVRAGDAYYTERLVADKDAKERFSIGFGLGEGGGGVPAEAVFKKGRRFGDLGKLTPAFPVGQHTTIAQGFEIQENRAEELPQATKIKEKKTKEEKRKEEKRKKSSEKIFFQQLVEERRAEDDEETAKFYEMLGPKLLDVSKIKTARK